MNQSVTSDNMPMHVISGAIRALQRPFISIIILLLAFPISIFLVYSKIEIRTAKKYVIWINALSIVSAFAIAILSLETTLGGSDLNPFLKNFQWILFLYPVMIILILKLMFKTVIDRRTLVFALVSYLDIICARYNTYSHDRINISRNLIIMLGWMMFCSTARYAFIILFKYIFKKKRDVLNEIEEGQETMLMTDFSNLGSINFVGPMHSTVDERNELDEVTNDNELDEATNDNEANNVTSDKESEINQEKYVYDTLKPVDEIYKVPVNVEETYKVPINHPKLILSIEDETQGKPAKVKPKKRSILASYIHKLDPIDEISKDNSKMDNK